MITLILLASGFGNSYALWLSCPVLYLRLLLLTLSASDKESVETEGQLGLGMLSYVTTTHLMFLSVSSVLEGGSENPLFPLGLAVSLSVLVNFESKLSLTSYLPVGSAR